MTNKSSPWLERQKLDRAGPKVLTPDEAEAAGLQLTEGAISHHVYRGIKYMMPESDLWVGGDFPMPFTSLDAKLSDGSPRFIKRPDGTMFDLYGTATRASMAEPNCPDASGAAAGGLTAQNAARPFFPPVGTAINTLHWVKDGIARPEVMEWTGDAWLMIGDATRYGPEHTELRGCEYLGSAHAEDEMAAHRVGWERDEAQKKLDSVTCERDNLRERLAEQTRENELIHDGWRESSTGEARNYCEIQRLRAELYVFITKQEPSINHALRVKIGDPRRMGP